LEADQLNVKDLFVREEDIWPYTYSYPRPKLKVFMVISGLNIIPGVLCVDLENGVLESVFSYTRIRKVFLTEDTLCVDG